MATLNKTEEEDLAKIISNLAENNERVTFQMVIDSLSDRIVSSCSDLASLEAQGPVWLQKITDVALANHVNLVRDTPSWKSIKTKIQEQDVPDSPSQPSDPYAASSAFFSPRSRLSSSELKIRIDEKEKDAIRETIKGFDKSKFWILEASIQEAALNGLPAESVLSVDEKVHKLALDSIFKHPSQSFIIDIDDPNWDDMFTTAELDEIIDFGPPVLPPVLQEVADIIAEFEQLPNALEAYNFARQLNHNPMEEPLKAWFCMTIMQTAYLFLKKDQHNIADFPETDKQYLIWGFLSSIFQGTDIWALGKEKSSVASAASANNKRKLSTTDEICRKAIGRKVDEVYICGNIELGCMEIGGSSTDQTKEIKDGRMKMPHVLKDMLLDIVTKSPTLVHKVNVTGYLISGTQVCMMDVDSPKGYITRIRRTMPMSFPTSADDYVVRMAPLLELATIAMQRMNETRRLFMGTKVPLQVSSRRNQVLPPSLPRTPSSSSSSASTKTTESVQKRQRSK